MFGAPDQQVFDNNSSKTLLRTLLEDFGLLPVTFSIRNSTSDEIITKISANNEKERNLPGVPQKASYAVPGAAQTWALNFRRSSKGAPYNKRKFNNRSRKEPRLSVKK